jgi:hypothetical protein
MAASAVLLEVGATAIKDLSSEKDPEFICCFKTSQRFKLKP